MKFTCAIILLTAASVSALQGPVGKAFGVASIAATVLVGGPLAAPALDPAPTALILNVKADINPLDAAKNVFAHRSQLQDAVKDFLSSAQKLGTDLDGVFPVPEVSVVTPTDENAKQAVLDTLAGQGRVVVNGEPVYFEVESQEGFFTFKVLSPILPKLPFLAPTDAQRASMVIPRAQTIYINKPVESAAVAKANSEKPFWELSFQVPVLNKDVTVTQAAEVAAVVVVGAYATTYGYYVVSQGLETRQNDAKMKANQEKAKKAKAAAAAKKALEALEPAEATK